MELKATVLLSIPHEPIRQQISGFLARVGCDTLDAATGREALLLAEQHAGVIDVLLSDMTPIEASRMVSLLSSRRPRLKALVISGDPSEVNQELLPDPKLTFIEKPFSWNDFQRVLKNLLELSNAA